MKFFLACFNKSAGLGDCRSLLPGGSPKLQLLLPGHLYIFLCIVPCNQKIRVVLNCHQIENFDVFM